MRPCDATYCHDMNGRAGYIDAIDSRGQTFAAPVGVCSDVRTYADAAQVAPDARERPRPDA